MRNIEDYVSTLVENQFPAFYRDEGPNFVEFVKEYFNYLESEGNALYYSRNLLEYRDIDKTIQSFILHFKEKYLKYFPYELAVEDARFLIKHVMDFYRSKGSERSYEIFFKSAYNTVPAFYYPKDDVFKLSDGSFYNPVYLEVVPTKNVFNLRLKQITGSISGATAFVEQIIKKRSHGRFICVLYLSNIQGIFQAGEFVTEEANPIIEGYPKVIGSLSSVDVFTGGQNFQIGDVLNIVDGSGSGGKVRVSEVSTKTGIVAFELVDGGFGFTSNAQVLVSTKVMDLAGNSTSFNLYETVRQPLANISFSSSNGAFTNGMVLEAWYSNGALAGNGVALAVTYTGANTGTILVSTRTGNIASGAQTSAGMFFNQGNTVKALTESISNVTATGNVMGTNATSIGVINVVNQFFNYNNNYIIGDRTSTNSSITSISVGSGATFKLGFLSNPETVRLDTTFIHDKNTGNVAFLDVKLDESNANVGGSGFGFPKFNTGGINAVLLDCFDISDNIIGTVTRIVSTVGGSQYTKSPFVRIFEYKTAGYNKKDLTMVVVNPVGGFGAGDVLLQTNESPATILTVNNFSGNTSIQAGEFIYQSNGSSNVATGYVYISSIVANAGTITVSNVAGTFVNTYAVKTLTTHTNSHIMTVNSAATITQTGKAQVKSYETINSTAIALELRRLSFFDTFAAGNTVVSDKGSTGTIQTVVPNHSTLRIGDNANVTANVVVGNNTVIVANVHNSGFGYIDNELQVQQ